MHFFKLRCIGLALVLPWCTTGLPWDAPQSTTVIHSHNPYQIHQAPVPTQPPSYAHLFHILKRQTRGTVSTSRGNSSSLSRSTCGFERGSTSHAYTCDLGYTCAYEATVKAIACCKSLACDLVTSCVPYTLISSCINDPACLGERYLTKCDASYPFCGTIIATAGFFRGSNLYCDSTTAPAVSLFLQATDGEKSSVLGYVEITLEKTTSASVTSTTIRSPTTSSASNPTMTASPTPSPESTPIAAIVGGTIGGILALGFLILGTLVLRHKGLLSVPDNNSKGMHETPTTPFLEGEYIPGGHQKAPVEIYHDIVPPAEISAEVPPVEISGTEIRNDGHLRTGERDRDESS